MKIEINGTTLDLNADAETPLLWIVREHLGLLGTKFGCGMALCGACTLHLDGVAVRSCVTPLSEAIGKKITTIEGLSLGEGLHPLQEAWVKFDVPQCGYCQSGQLMQAASLLKSNPHPNAEQIDAGMSGNICRCGTYPRIKAAILDVVHGTAPSKGNK
jgi:isoquinoline 1-oxidoreductase subunit alpha